MTTRLPASCSRPPDEPAPSSQLAASKARLSSPSRMLRVTGAGAGGDGAGLGEPELPPPRRRRLAIRVVCLVSLAAPLTRVGATLESSPAVNHYSLTSRRADRYDIIVVFILMITVEARAREADTAARRGRRAAAGGRNSFQTTQLSGHGHG
jgi:hypothetical protein